MASGREAHAFPRKSLDRYHQNQASQPFFSGEVEPCINGRTVALGVYFGQNVDGVVSCLLSEQLGDGGWNCEAENGSVHSSFATTINVLEGLLAHSNISARWEMRRTRGCAKRSACFDPNSNPMVSGNWRTRIQEGLTLHWRTATLCQVDGIRCGRCVSFINWR